MSDYIKLTLDTTPPEDVEMLINGGAAYTFSRFVELKVSCADSDTQGYSIKVWGVDGVDDEDDAPWEEYFQSKLVSLSEGDGEKTVYVKVRDDLFNESDAVCDTVSYRSSPIPFVKGLTVDTSKIFSSGVRRTASLIWNVDKDFDAVKIMLVDDVNAAYDDDSNISIPTANGSHICGANGKIISTGDYMEIYNYKLSSNVGMSAVLYARDITAVSPENGIKVIKVFVRSCENGNWSE